MFNHDKASSQGKPRTKIKKLMFALGAVAAVSVATSNPLYAASTYPWCLEDVGLDCSYSSFEQCNRNVQGRGGTCIKFG